MCIQQLSFHDRDVFEFAPQFENRDVAETAELGVTDFDDYPRAGVELADVHSQIGNVDSAGSFAHDS